MQREVCFVRGHRARLELVMDVGRGSSLGDGETPAGGSGPTAATMISRRPRKLDEIRDSLNLQSEILQLPFSCKSSS